MRNPLPLRLTPPVTPTCTEPFESGPRLCRHCRTQPDPLGIRRCSLVVAESGPMRAVMARVAKIAASRAPVVILGESGTGKEVIARTIHANSPRRGRRFVAVNVGAIPHELLESELFGHARGAFTGATERKVGLFEEADGGTLFLDEIAEMPLPLQVKLLRVLQDGEVRRVGEARPFSVDVRILCATHRPLSAMVGSGQFREDLYYRLKVFTVTLPPLRERKEDIPLLVGQFLYHAGRAPDPGGVTTLVQPRALEALLAWRWPGNIRELMNAVEHAAVLSGEEPIDVPHLPEEIVEPARAAPADRDAKETVLRPLADVERDHILRVLQALGGNQVEAAHALGISRSTLWRKLRTFGVD